MVRWCYCCCRRGVGAVEVVAAAGVLEVSGQGSKASRERGACVRVCGCGVSGWCGFVLRAYGLARLVLVPPQGNEGEGFGMKLGRLGGRCVHHTRTTNEHAQASLLFCPVLGVVVGVHGPLSSLSAGGVVAIIGPMELFKNATAKARAGVFTRHSERWSPVCGLSSFLLSSSVPCGGSSLVP